MKTLLTIFLLTISAVSHAGTTHLDKNIKDLHSPDSRPCVFFTLVDVNVADASVNQSEWFSLSINHTGYNFITSVLLSAKMADKSISVSTTGNNICGHAEVSVVILK